MYLKIDEKLLKKVEKITMTDYETQGELLPTSSVEPIIEDLLLEISRIEEQIDDMKQDLESNYKMITPAEMYE